MEREEWIVDVGGYFDRTSSFWDTTTEDKVKETTRQQAKNAVMDTLCEFRVDKIIQDKDGDDDNIVELVFTDVRKVPKTNNLWRVQGEFWVPDVSIMAHSSYEAISLVRWLFEFPIASELCGKNCITVQM